MLLSIAQISKTTGHTKHVIEGFIKKHNVQCDGTEKVGRFPRRLYDANKIIEALKDVPKHGRRLGPHFR